MNFKLPWMQRTVTNGVAGPTTRATATIKLPKWLQRSKLELPDWARSNEDNVMVRLGKVSLVIEASTDGYIREWFELLKPYGAQIDAPDQYWLEVAYQCAKMDLQGALGGTPFDPRVTGKPVGFHFDRAEQWALDKHPAGRGIWSASQGKEAREHYRTIRGSLPM